MRTTLITVIGLVLLAACGKKTDSSCPVFKEIATSSVVKNNDVWDVAITSNIEAPIDKVLDAASHPEKGAELVPDNIRRSEILSENGNTKMLDIIARLDYLPPGFQQQQIKTEYTYYPEQKRFTTKSIDFGLADIVSEYKFEPSSDGKSTVVKLSETSKPKSAMVVESLQKGALCETFAIQMRVLRRAVGLDKAPAAG